MENRNRKFSPEEGRKGGRIKEERRKGGARCGSMCL
jgi:hypothetical protein